MVVSHVVADNRRSADEAADSGEGHLYALGGNEELRGSRGIRTDRLEICGLSIGAIGLGTGGHFRYDAR